MSSISSRNIAILPVVPEVEEKKVEVVVEEVKVTRFIALSDVDLNDNIRSQFRGEFEKIVEFSIETFANRSLAFFESISINNLWINLHKKGARDWISTNIQKADSWKVLIVTNSSSKQEWIDALKDFSTTIVKFADIKNIKSLSLDELLEKVQALHLKKPLGLCAKVASCIFGSKGQKN